jgi:ABC-type nitrate/sulfonate/bicarbonate transport system substrate-binding protein
MEMNRGLKKTLVLILAITLVFAFAGCAKNPDKVTFVLDWTPNTNHTGIYVALDMGYFEDAGLDVEIIQPADGTAEQLVAAGTAQFGISYQENVIFARAQGMPIVSLAAVIQHNTSGFISMKEKGIMSPADFEDKKYGGWGTEIEEATVRYLMEQNGADPSKVEIVTMGDTDFFASSDAGEVDFSWVFAGWTLMDAKIKGYDVNYFDMVDYSEVFDYYTPVIIAAEDSMNNNKKMVESFMAAAAKGYEYAIDNPENAARILLKYAPELDENLVVQSQAYLADKYVDDAPYWGFQDKAVWDRYTNWLLENEFIDEQLDTGKAFTNEYLND